MANKRWFLFAAVFALRLSAVFAQAENSAAAGAAPAESAPEDLPDQNYYIDRSGDEPRFIQRLAWDDAGYVLRYEVIVQRQAQDGSYSEVNRLSVD